METLTQIVRTLVLSADQTFACTEARKKQYVLETGRRLLQEQHRSQLIPEFERAVGAAYAQRADMPERLPATGALLRTVGDRLATLKRARKAIKGQFARVS